MTINDLKIFHVKLNPNNIFNHNIKIEFTNNEEEEKKLVCFTASVIYNSVNEFQ